MPYGRRAWGLLVIRLAVVVALMTFGLSYIMSVPRKSYAGSFAPLSESETVLRDRLKEHVISLAEEIGERNVWREDNLEKAARYIEKVLTDIGCSVATQAVGGEGTTVRNVEVEITGEGRRDEIVVVGAHYDSVMGCPGANDNASGVAAVLEIARMLVGKRMSRTVRLVAFVNEEPPFFRTDGMGSRIYAVRSRQRGEKIVGMLAIETIGFYSDDKGSQHYPFPFGLFYPDTANFIGFVGNMSSRALVRRAISSFRQNAAFPSEGVAAPGWLTGIGWSDHWSFWKEGYPAIMITDTALFRYMRYHTPQDSWDKIRYDPMARVVAGIAAVVADLAGD